MFRGKQVQNMISGTYATVTSDGYYTNSNGFIRLGVKLDNGQYRQWSYLHIREVKT